MTIQNQWKIFFGIVALLIVAGIGIAANQMGLFSTGTPNLLTPPSLSGSVSFSRDLTPEAREALGTSIEELRTSLRENPASFDAWLTLAIRYKGAGDLEKAKQVWEYLAARHPDDGVSRHNLADLYHHHLVDYAKAEEYYIAAIDAAPAETINYLSLYDLYKTTGRQNTDASLTLLKTGVENIPEPQVLDVYVALAKLYQAKADKTNAIVYYKKARNIAANAGDTNRVAQYDAMIAMLQR